MKALIAETRWARAPRTTRGRLSVRTFGFAGTVHLLNTGHEPHFNIATQNFKLPDRILPRMRF
ncbi:hypothetical protein C6558_32720 [Ensifer sp. NM-2]|nr:hypothetical protein C6558_32720 [Ensifer sp. NM-2]